MIKPGGEFFSKQFKVGASEGKFRGPRGIGFKDGPFEWFQLRNRTDHETVPVGSVGFLLPRNRVITRRVFEANGRFLNVSFMKDVPRFFSRLLSIYNYNQFFVKIKKDFVLTFLFDWFIFSGSVFPFFFPSRGLKSSATILFKKHLASSQNEAHFRGLSRIKF